jgi:uncharacterized protein
MSAMFDKQPVRAVRGLQFNVAQLLKQPTGTRRSYDIQADWPPLDDQLVVVAPLRGRVRLLRIGKGVLVTSELETVLELACNRCLSDYRLAIRFELEEEFRPTIDVVTGVWLELEPDQDRANLIDEHHILDLTEVVRQAVWLSLPMSLACRPDCRGLCPSCGQNLNEGNCACQPDVMDARWLNLMSSITRPED